MRLASLACQYYTRTETSPLFIFHAYFSLQDDTGAGIFARHAHILLIFIFRFFAAKLYLSHAADYTRAALPRR